MTNKDFRELIDRLGISREQAMTVFGVGRTKSFNMNSASTEIELDKRTKILCEALSFMGDAKAKKFAKLKIAELNETEK